MKLATIEILDDALEALCLRFQVQELALFGSALDDRFGPDSDIDLLVAFVPGARIGLFELGELKNEWTTPSSEPVARTPLPARTRRRPHESRTALTACPHFASRGR